MKDFHDFTVLTTDTKQVPRVYDFRVDKGLITWAGLYFPPGCHGRINAVILFQAHQIMPRTPGKWARGNNGWWGGEVTVPVTASPLNIKAEGYPVDTNFDHTITIGIEIVPFPMIPRWDKLIEYNEKLLRALGVSLPKPEPEEMKIT